MTKPTTYTTTPEHFALFVKEAKEFIELFGLKDWRITFLHEKGEEWVRANCYYNCKGRSATIRLLIDWGLDNPTDTDIKRAAYHEVLELMLGSIRQIGLDHDLHPRQKEYEQDTEAHAIIRRLENAYL